MTQPTADTRNVDKTYDNALIIAKYMELLCR